jgi:hypothetical protein
MVQVVNTMPVSSFIGGSPLRLFKTSKVVVENIQSQELNSRLNTIKSGVVPESPNPVA